MSRFEQAVEAAAREFYKPMRWDSVGPDLHRRWMDTTRASLLAALPVLVDREACASWDMNNAERGNDPMPSPREAIAEDAFEWSRA